MCQCILSELCLNVYSLGVRASYAVCFADRTHKRLVAYYTRMGFEFEREVGGNGLADVPHLLVWGGVGTRMNGDVPLLLGRWSRAMLASKDWGPRFDLDEATRT